MIQDRNKPSAVILDMLRSARSRHRTARSLIAAGELFSFSENTMRVTLSRLMARGIIESPERGLYRLARQTDALNDFLERWRLGEARVRPWRSGRWLFAHAPPARVSDRAKGETTASEWALGALGFREVRPALFVRPDNLALKTEELRTLASGIGVDPGVLLVTGQPEGDPAPQSWLQAWHPTRLDDGYADALRRLDESARRLPKLASDRARLECFSLGGEMIHRLAKDPLLPGEFINVQAREALWRAMLDYDVLGKDIWASGKEEALRRMPRPQLDMAR
jgi:phenylacetic acid degradation operon negative regulatory protein